MLPKVLLHAESEQEALHHLFLCKMNNLLQYKLSTQIHTCTLFYFTFTLDVIVSPNMNVVCSLNLHVPTTLFRGV